MDENVMAIATVLIEKSFNFLPVLNAIQNFGGSPVIGIV